jgi:cell wall-associated NlpC family hydrolase
MNEQAKRKRVMETARTYLGVPFKHQGRTRSGVDCVGLIVCVAHDLGLSKADFTAYPRVPDGRTFQAELRKHLDQKFGDPEPGDIVVLALGPYPCHVGIITDHGIIHALERCNRVAEHRLSSDWRAKIRGVYAWRNWL